jgi:hypothetical protein
MRLHPDKVHPDDRAECEEAFKRVNTVYEVLSNAADRSVYDRLGKKGLRGARPREADDAPVAYDSIAAALDAGMVPVLLPLLTSSSSSSRHEVAMLLAQLMRRREGARSVMLSGSLADVFMALREARAVAPLLSLLRSGSCEAAQAQAAWALCQLACDSEGRAAMLSAGSVAPLVQLLRSNGEEDQLKAAHILTALTSKFAADAGLDAAVAAVAAGAIPALLPLLVAGAECSREAALLAAQLMQCLEGVAAVTAAGKAADVVMALRELHAFGPLLALLHGCDCEAVKSLAAWALRDLACGHVGTGYVLAGLANTPWTT